MPFQRQIWKMRFLFNGSDELNKQILVNAAAAPLNMSLGATDSESRAFIVLWGGGFNFRFRFRSLSAERGGWNSPQYPQFWDESCSFCSDQPEKKNYNFFFFFSTAVIKKIIKSGNLDTI